MIAEVETETPSQAAAANQYQSAMAEETPPRRRVNLLLIGAVVLGLVALGVVWYVYSLGYESTDDAQVDGHLNPIAARIDGKPAATLDLVEVREEFRADLVGRKLRLKVQSGAAVREVDLTLRELV